MKTRFDNEKNWRTAFGQVVAIEDMETTHIMNTVRMFILKPNLTQAMLIADVESYKDSSSTTPWDPESEDIFDNIFKSLTKITSMSAEETFNYVIACPLVCAMEHELVRRGVNFRVFVENVLAERRNA